MLTDSVNMEHMKNAYDAIVNSIRNFQCIYLWQLHCLPLNAQSSYKITTYKNFNRLPIYLRKIERMLPGVRKLRFLQSIVPLMQKSYFIK